MARTKATIQQELETTRRRLDAYLDREADMLAKNGVQSYGIGSRNIQYYSTALKDIQDMIEKLRAGSGSWRLNWRGEPLAERWALSRATGKG